MAVTTSDGSSYTADRVILTVPIGVLHDKVSRNDFFLTPLSPHKATALSSWGVGRVARVFLRFPYTFWPTDRVVGFLHNKDAQHNNTDEDYAAGADWTTAIGHASQAEQRCTCKMQYSVTICLFL